MRTLSSQNKKFKRTEEGEIPKEWEVVRLGDVANKFVSGGTPSTKKSEYWNGNIPWMRSAWIKNRVITSGEKCITREGLENSATNIVPKGNILVATRVCIGNVAINEIEIAVSQDLTGIVIKKEKACPEFVYWVLANSEKKMKALIQGSTIKGVLREDLKNLKILLPPLPEQRKIASILSTVDEAIQKTDEIIQKTQELKRGLMQELLTRGIGHTRFKRTEIGEIPEEWELVKIEDVLSQPPQYGLSVKLFSKGDYPILKMDNLENGQVVIRDLKYVNIDKKLFDQFKLEKEDILFNRTNAFDLVGRVGIFLLDGDYTFASYLIRLRISREKADPYFVNYYLNADSTQRRLKTLATRGVSQANINAKNLKFFLLPRLPILEQQKIVSTLSAIDEKIEKEKQRKEQLEKLKRGLAQDLLTGKIRVRVD